ncbi:MAG: TIGR03564 family F420-dependent LLM class oxidoreductase [Ardenticatenaceae bacterium]
MRIGLINVNGAMPFRELMEQVVQAERDGFDHFWFAHLPFNGYDALTVISMAGQQTSRIELGTAVVPTFARHPLILAQQALTAQLLAGGRLALGMGVSHKPVVENAMGLSYQRPARQIREYLSIVRALANEGRVDFSGELFKVKASMDVPGSSPFPILIAALGKQMLRLAGEVADGTITWMVGQKTLASHIVPRINAAADGAGRPQPRVCVALPIAVTDDLAAGQAYVAHVYKRYGQLTNYRRVLDIEGVAGPADVAVLGNEEQVEHHLRALADAGMTDFLGAICPIGDDPAASVARTWALLKKLKSEGRFA